MGVDDGVVYAAYYLEKYQSADCYQKLNDHFVSGVDKYSSGILCPIAIHINPWVQSGGFSNDFYMIIGLTGSMGCGKGEIVKILEREGFKYITLSMMVREEARRRGIVEEREKLMEVGNMMRKEGGAGVLAKKALVEIMNSGHDKWVVDGIRNPAEIAELRKGKDVYIVGINTDRKLLVERIISRNRESDVKIPAFAMSTRVYPAALIAGRQGKRGEDILRKIRREWGEGEPSDGQQVGKCMEKVDILIDNNGSLEDFARRFAEYYESIVKKSKNN